MSEQEQDFTPSSLESIFQTADIAPAEDDTGTTEDTPKTDTSDSSTKAEPGKTEEKAGGEDTKPDDKSEASTDDKDTGDKDTDAPPASDKKDDDSKSHSVPLAVMLEEREKRKSAEAELQKLKEGSQEEQQKPSVFDDEDAYRDSIQNAVRGEFQQKFLAMSEKMAVDQHGEEAVQAAVDRLADFAKKDPQLAVRFRDATSPFHEAIEIVKEQEELEAYRNGTLKEQLKEQARKELEAEQQKAEEDEIPGSLASESGTGVGAGSEWQGPTKLEDALQQV